MTRSRAEQTPMPTGASLNVYSRQRQSPLLPPFSNGSTHLIRLMNEVLRGLRSGIDSSYFGQ